MCREESFPSAATLWGARVLGCGKALHSSELAQPCPAGAPGERGGGVDLCFLVAAVCVELCGRKKVSAIFALEQAVFLQYCLPHLCKIISIEIKALWTPRGFHSIRHLKRKNQILQSIHENTLHQREDRGTTEQSQSCECFIFSVVDLTYKTGPKAFSGTARIGKA